MTRIKICCIGSHAEAELAIEAGAHALGLVSAMPSGPGVIDEATIADIAAAVPPPVATFLLTSLTSVDAIVDQHRRCRTTTLQIVDRLSVGTHGDLRRALPGIGIVQVFHVTGPEVVAEAVEAAPHVDALLLDSGRPDASVRELGGTGRVHDWTLSRQIRATCGKPVFLAGGLAGTNVAAAVVKVRPFAVDVCSGVRTGGALDQAKLHSFVAQVKEADG